jgi:purine-binding chemotaxis protein CheW
MTSTATALPRRRAVASEPASRSFVTAAVGGQVCGLPVLDVREVMRTQPGKRIPLAPPEVAGALNLRGRIVTIVDVRARLGLAPATDAARGMTIVVEHQRDLYGLMMDWVGDVVDLPSAAYGSTPATLDARWRSTSEGVYRLDWGLLVVLDVGSLLKVGEERDAA